MYVVSTYAMYKYITFMSNKFKKTTDYIASPLKQKDKINS